MKWKYSRLAILLAFFSIPLFFYSQPASAWTGDLPQCDAPELSYDWRQEIADGWATMVSQSGATYGHTPYSNSYLIGKLGSSSNQAGKWLYMVKQTTNNTPKYFEPRTVSGDNKVYIQDSGFKAVLLDSTGGTNLEYTTIMGGVLNFDDSTFAGVTFNNGFECIYEQNFTEPYITGIAVAYVGTFEYNTPLENYIAENPPQTSEPEYVLTNYESENITPRDAKIIGVVVFFVFFFWFIHLFRYRGDR